MKIKFVPKDMWVGLYVDTHIEKGIRIRKEKKMRDTWKPIRCGVIYCSSECGANCTFADYQSAHRNARKLCKKLGKGWKPVVHENLGWHYRAMRGSVAVYSSYLGGYSACIGDNWWARGDTPREAVARSVAEARAEAAGILKSVEGL